MSNQKLKIPLCRVLRGKESLNVKEEQFQHLQQCFLRSWYFHFIYSF